MSLLYSASRRATSCSYFRLAVWPGAVGKTRLWWRAKGTVLVAEYTDGLKEALMNLRGSRVVAVWTREGSYVGAKFVVRGTFSSSLPFCTSILALTGSVIVLFATILLAEIAVVPRRSLRYRIRFRRVIIARTIR